MQKTTYVAWAGIALLAASLCGAQTPAQPFEPHAIGTVAKGETKAAACMACHGPKGNSSNPEWPNLAGQNAVYTSEQLHLYRDGKRANPVMMPLAKSLTDEDIADLSVYYEAQTPAGLEADPSYWKLGESLYVRGDAARELPACIACHGPIGRGNLAAGYPALRAQHSVYTVKQLNDYATGVRYQKVDSKLPSRNGPMMDVIARRLTPEDIRNLASYIQGLR